MVTCCMKTNTGRGGAIQSLFKKQLKRSRGGWGWGEKMEKVGGLGGRGRSVGVIGSNVVIQRFNTLV